MQGGCYEVHEGREVNNVAYLVNRMVDEVNAMRSDIVALRNRSRKSGLPAFTTYGPQNTTFDQQSHLQSTRSNLLG